MANYSTATVFPSTEEMSTAYRDQSRASAFVEDGFSVCQQLGIHIEDLTRFVTQYLLSSQASHKKVEDLQILMNKVNEHFQLGLSTTNNRLYKAIKALPHFSPGRIGYTYRRKAGGVFVFLFY